MKTQRVPFLPISRKKARQVAKHYLGWGQKVAGAFKSLDWEIEQSRMDYETKEWAAIAVYSLITYFFVTTTVLFVIFIAAHLALGFALGISILAGFGFSFGVFMFQMMYPKFLLSRKVKEIDKNLPFALHHLLIHIRSGVPLFNSLVSVAKSDYGTLSKEFRIALQEINTGVSEATALEKMARDNPSIHLRRVMWQLVNAIKSGADIGATLKEIVDNLMAEQKTAIKKYGSELNPMALFYMMLVVIFPTLGIIFILVLFSLIGSAIDMQFVLIGILVFVIVMQFMFIGMIKSKRPTGI